MSQLEWNEETLPSLTRRYLMQVKKNMRPGSTVRFGLMGNGTSPNYELELSDGSRLPYRGQSHKRDERGDAFEEKHLSPPFTLEQLQDAIARAPSATDKR